MSQDKKPEEVLKELAQGLSPNTLVNLITLASKGAKMTEEKPTEKPAEKVPEEPAINTSGDAAEKTTSSKDTSIEIVDEKIDLKTRQDLERKKRRAAALLALEDETAKKISKTVSSLSIFILFKFSLML